MGKFGCTCGNSISLNSIPEFNEAKLITDIALDNVAGDNVSADRLPGRIVYECDDCGRLWIQKEPKSDYWISFMPEAGPLKFRDDYGKGFREEPPDDPELFEVKPEEIVERYAGVTLRAKLNAGYRGVVGTHPLEHPFKVERAMVPTSTPSEILLHAPALLQPTPINLALSEESGRLGLQRALFKPGLAYGKGERVEFEVENTLDVDFDLVLGVFGRVATADMPLSTSKEPPS